MCSTVQATYSHRHIFVRLQTTVADCQPQDVASPASALATFKRVLVTNPFQVNRLVDLKTFCDDPENNPRKVPLKTLAQRKAYVEKLGLKVVRHPKSGVESVPVLDKVIMLTGHRRSASRIKDQEFDTKEETKDAVSKAASGLKVQSNTKDLGSSVGFCHQVFKSRI